MDNEFQQVSRRLAGLAAKRPGFALGLWGEPGIGKTHTALALLRNAPCQTRSVHATQALENIIQGFPRPKKLTLWLEKILERLANGEALETGMLNQALVALLAANSPIILHVEDLHETSIERLEFWQQLAQAISRTRGVGLIATSRVQPPEHLEAIRLTALTREESDALLESEAKSKLPSEALAWLFERAVGNPLFTLEFFRFLARLGSLWNDGQRWRWRTPERETMPVTVEALIEQMLRDTSSTHALEQALGAKAMLGLGASESLWAEVANLSLEEFKTVKHELEYQGVLVNAEFVHPLFREVLANGLSASQRQTFARRALEVLKDDPRAAAGFVKDAELEDQVALEWFLKAAQAASDAEDKIQAAQFKAKAVDYAVGEEKGRLALEAARELRHYDLRESARLAEVTLNIQENNKDAIFLRAEMLAIQGRNTEVQELLTRLSANEQSGSSWLIQQLRMLAARGDSVGVLKLCQDQPELLETGNPEICLRVAWALAEYGENTRAQIVAERGLAQPELTLDQRAGLLNVCGAALDNQGDYFKAEMLFSQVLTINQQIGHLRSIAAAYFNRGMSRKNLGLYHEMSADLLEVLRLTLEIGDGKRYAYTQAFLAGALIPFGEYEQAEEALLDSRNTLERLGISTYLLECETQLSVLYLAWHSSHGEMLALKYAQASLDHARHLGSPSSLVDSLFYAIQAHVSNGYVSKGLELAEEMFDLLKTIDASPYWYNAYFARATAFEADGQNEEAGVGFRKAIELTTNQLSIQTALLEIDRLTNDLEGARERMKWFEERGLKNGVNIALRYFPELALNTDAPASTSPEPHAHLEVLGSMQITLESQHTPVRGRKRQELLALLLEARISGRTEVSKLELVEKLYPDSDELQSNAGIRDVIYQVRSSLGDAAITTTTNGYSLGNLGSDIEEFLKDGDTKRWRGTYLEGLTLEGSDTVRESVYLALRSRAEALLEGDPVEVARLGRLLCEADPYDLEAVRLTLTGLRSGQNHRSLSRFYGAARARFLEIGEELPESWQVFLSPVTSH